MNKTEKIWMNGELLNWEDSKIHILTHTLHYGSGVFEGIRCYKTEKGTAVFRLKEHVERFFASAEYLHMKIPYSKEEITNAILETLRVNKLEAGYIRPIAYFGYGEMGLNTKNCKVDVSIAVWPWGTYLGEEALKNGVKAKISKYRRLEGPLNQAKICGNYFNSTLAKIEALDNGYEESIMFDNRGLVAEGTGENIFLIKDGKLITPKSGSILLGITRNSIMELAKEKGIEVIEKDITKEELLDADEAFLTGTAAEVTPINSIDGKPLKEIKLALELQKEFFEVVKAKNGTHPEWLTFV